MIVIWKDIEGYEGLYKISSEGKIINSKGKEIKQREHYRDGYFLVNLSKDGKAKTYQVHRLVANAFIMKVRNKNEINHKNGIKKDNSISNLEWCTSKENSNHAYDNDMNRSSYPVILENRTTGELLKFRSMAKGSEYMGQSSRFISDLVNEGIYKTERFNIFVQFRS